MEFYSSFHLTVSLLLINVAFSFQGCRKDLLVRTESGWVCGSERTAENGKPYASFRGIPYAKQPLGELRFKELQPVDPWKTVLNATTEGPVCYQHNIFFGPLMAPQGVSESCIHVNIHVPLDAVPRPGKRLQRCKLLPIFVFYHGGGWISGSGDADMNGPEYLVGKDVMVITFNYRVDVFGFLSLNTTKIPGNNGLRDCITLLRWVKRNARAFGGDPHQVTLAGESAGANNAHLISLSPVSKGLFNRLWLMTGTAIPTNHVTSPLYAKQLANTFLANLGLNDTDYDSVHDKLVKMPIEEIHEASRKLLPLGLTTFMTVQESPLPGVTAIIADDPEKLLANGNGDDIPIVVGFNSNECQTFRPRFEDLDIVEKCKEDPLCTLPRQLLYTLPLQEQEVMAEKLAERYFDGEPTMDKYLKLCTESLFLQPTFRFVRDRAARCGAPVYLYKFSYEADYSVIKIILNTTFPGAGHIEDLTFVLKVNSVPVPFSSRDGNMRDWMSSLVANYVKTSSPSPKRFWPCQCGNQSLGYQDFVTPYVYHYTGLSDDEKDYLRFYDELYGLEPVQIKGCGVRRCAMLSLN